MEAITKEKEKREKRGINYKLVGRMLRGTGGYFAIAVVGLIVAVLSAYVIPIVTAYTIDLLKPFDVQGAASGTTVPKFIVDWIESIGGSEFLIKHLYIMGIALLIATAVNALSTYLRRSYIAYAGETMAKNLRDELYGHLANLPYDYHKHVSTGDLVQRCTSDVDTVRRFVQNQLLEIIRTVLMVIFAAVIMIRRDPMLTLWSVILMPFLTLSSFIYFRAVKDSFTKADEAEGALSAALQENVTGVRVVRAFGQQKNELDNFTEKNTDYRKKNGHVIDLMAYYWGVSDGFGYLQIAISLCVGVYFVIIHRITVGTLEMFIAYTAMLTWPVRQLGRILADLGRATVSLGRIDDIISSPLETEPGLALTPEIRGRVEFKNVSFSYDDAEISDETEGAEHSSAVRGAHVLNNVSFVAEPGQTIAILGSTGSGKSSLVQLMQRLYTVKGGEILIDGVNVNDIERHYLRKNIGLVLQEPFLYSRTIKENIAIAAPGATEDAIFGAARIASIHDVVQGFENGYETVVGERGVTLSGGQKQRVAIARMLMQNAPIIILDDSMSAVDTETDAAIRDALAHRGQSCTTFIISHRITTLCKADKILVLEHGELVQQGTHEELLKQPGLYQRVANIQNMLEDELKQEEGGIA